MIAGDYEQRQEWTSTGKLQTLKIVKSTTGVEYRIGKKFGAGGMGSVSRAWRVQDRKFCVFKEYTPSPDMQRIHKSIRNNIKRLMEHPLTESSGKPLTSFIGPMDTDSLIDLPASGGFGYIMEKVDTGDFLSVPKLRHADVFPDADVLCRAGYNIAHFFQIVHHQGWCYKDINEGNIYINGKTGEVRIIDCDNISVQSVRVIKGTDGYMAPEVYVTGEPNTYTDYFSMAVLFYRLLVGGYPMEGRQAMEYLRANNLSIQEAASTIYGDRALFAFDPVNPANEIRTLTDPQRPLLYKSQVFNWDWLAPELRERFIQTFSTGLRDSSRRATDRDWLKTFEKVEKNGCVRCRCGRVNFGSVENGHRCLFCQGLLKSLAPPPPPRPASSAPRPASGPATSSSVQKPQAGELTTVQFAAKRDVAPTSFLLEMKRQQTVSGSVYPELLKNGWAKVLYSRTKKALALQNCSDLEWSSMERGERSVIPSGKHVVLKVGMVITVKRRKLQLTVKNIW